MGYKAGEVYVEAKITLQPLEAGLKTMTVIAEKTAKQFEAVWTQSFSAITGNSGKAVTAVASNFGQLPALLQKSFDKMQSKAAGSFTDMQFYSKNFVKEGSKDATKLKNAYSAVFDKISADAKRTRVDVGGKTNVKASKTDQATGNAWDNLFVEKYTMAYRAEHIGRAMFFTITWPLYNMTKRIAEVAIEAQTSLQRLQAVTGSTTEKMTELRKSLAGMALKTYTPAPELTKGLIELAKAGFSYGQSLKMVEPIAIMAKGNMMDLATSTELTINVMKAYGFEADKTTMVTNLLAKASDSAAMDIKDMAAAMKYVAPIASAFNVDIREASAAIAVLSDAGMKGSMGGTAMRGIYFKLAKPTPQSQKIMERYNINPFDEDGALKSLANIVEMFDKSMISTSETLTIFQQRAGVGFMNLLNMGAERIREMEKKVSDFEGYNEKLLKVQMANMVGAINTFKVAIQNLAIAIGAGGLNDKIKQWAERLTDLANKFANTSDGTKKFVIEAVKIGAVTPVLLWVIGTLIRFGKLLQDTWNMAVIMLAKFTGGQLASAAATKVATVAIGEQVVQVTLLDKAQKGAVLSGAALTKKFLALAGAASVYAVAIAALLYVGNKLATPEVIQKFDKMADDTGKSLRGMADQVKVRMHNTKENLEDGFEDLIKKMRKYAVQLEGEGNNVGASVVGGIASGMQSAYEFLSGIMASIAINISTWLNNIKSDLAVGEAMQVRMNQPGHLSGRTGTSFFGNYDLTYGTVAPYSDRVASKIPKSDGKYVDPSIYDLVPIEVPKGASEDYKKVTKRRAQARYETSEEFISDMFKIDDAIFKNTQGNYAYQKMLLERQKQDYLEAGHDKLKVEEWFNSEVKILDEEEADRRQKAGAAGTANNKKELDQQLKDQERYYEEVARLQMQLDDRIFELTHNETDVKIRNINKQYAEYQKYSKDLVGISEWYGLEIKAINDEMMKIKHEEWLEKFDNMMSKGAKIVNKFADVVGNAIKKEIEGIVAGINKAFDALENRINIAEIGSQKVADNFHKQKTDPLRAGSELLDPSNGQQRIEDLLFPQKTILDHVKDYNQSIADLGEEEADIRKTSAEKILEIEQKGSKDRLALQEKALKLEENVMNRRKKNQEDLYGKKRSLHDMFMEGKISGQDMQKIQNWMATQDLKGMSKEDISRGISGLGIDNSFYFDEEGKYNASQANSLIDNIYDIGQAQQEGVDIEKDYASDKKEIDDTILEQAKQHAQDIVDIKQWENDELARILKEREQLADGFGEATKRLVIAPGMAKSEEDQKKFIDSELAGEERAKENEDFWRKGDYENQRLRNQELRDKEIAKAEEPASDKNFYANIAEKMGMAPEDLEAWLNSVTPGWQLAGVSFADFLFKGMQGGLENPESKEQLFAAVDNVCQGLEGRFDDYFQIHSPSKLMYDKMGMIIQGMTDAVPVFGQGLLDAIDTLLSGVLSRVSAIQDALSGASSQGVDETGIGNTYVFNNVNMDEREVVRQIDLVDMAMGHNY